MYAHTHTHPQYNAPIHTPTRIHVDAQHDSPNLPKLDPCVGAKSFQNGFLGAPWAPMDAEMAPCMHIWGDVCMFLSACCTHNTIGLMQRSQLVTQSTI